MRRALRRLISVLCFWRPPSRLVKITVWHRMTVIGTITDETTLAAVDALWSAKIALPRATRTTFQYSLDLQRLRGAKSSSTRWLYNAEGLARVLAIPVFGIHIPVYRIPAPDALNRLVGIDIAAPDPGEGDLD